MALRGIRFEAGDRMGTGASWKEWENPDGTKEALLIFPEDVSEEKALAEVGVDGRGLIKTGHRHFVHDKTYVCEYQVLGEAVIETPRPGQ